MPLPAGEGDQIVSSHEPDEAMGRAAGAQSPQRAEGQAGSEFDFRGDDLHTSPANGMTCRAKPCWQRCHPVPFLQRVLRAHDPPNLVKPQQSLRQIGKMEMAVMRWIEGAAKKTDSQPALIVKQPGRPVAPALIAPTLIVSLWTSRVRIAVRDVSAHCP